MLREAAAEWELRATSVGTERPRGARPGGTSAWKPVSFVGGGGGRGNLAPLGTLRVAAGWRAADLGGARSLERRALPWRPTRRWTRGSSPAERAFPGGGSTFPNGSRRPGGQLRVQTEGAARCLPASSERSVLGGAGFPGPRRLGAGCQGGAARGTGGAPGASLYKVHPEEGPGPGSLLGCFRSGRLC